MFFHISLSNGVPVYEQIARQVTFAIASGGIVVDEMVPSVRSLSRELAVNPNTVARAYRQLQDSGVLETVRGEGLVVTSGANRQCKTNRKRLMSERIQTVLEEAWQSHLSESEINSLVADGLAASKKSVKQQRSSQE